MAKNQKIDVVDKEFTLSLNKSTAQQDIDKINSVDEKDKNSKHALNLVVNKKLILKFEQLLGRFKKKTNAYFTYPSKVHLFETGCYFLRSLMTENNTYHTAPKAFIKHIGRKGKRPYTDEHNERKGNSRPMYLTVDTEVSEIYYNLIYSFLRSKDDIGSQVYSTSYFFKDFIELLSTNYHELCAFESKNPRE